MSVVVRFAPSPTGYLHIGGARTALFNYLFAKNKGGKFLLRIEDTDKERSTQAAVDAILQGLEWLGLKHDGEIFFQSKREKRHQEIAHELVQKGQAYYCYTSEEELEKLRKDAEDKKQVFRFKSPWRDSTATPPQGVKPVIRLKVPKEGVTMINDLVQGQVTVSNVEIDDLVILRSDGTPTYMLAVVVDDHDMAVTHIIRGDDHLTNTFKQKVIYQAMGWNVPEFAHIPLIHGADGAKMSKRHGATSVIEYKEMGYLPESLRNYLLRLGWSHSNDEIISDQDAIKWFNLENVGKSPSRFDFAKLDNLNKHYIKQKNDEDLFELLNFFRKPLKNEKEMIVKALKFLKERAANLNELAKISEVYFDRPVFVIKDRETLELLKEKNDSLIQIKDLLAEIPDKNFNHDEIKNHLMNFAENKGLKIKDFGPVLRAALTGESSGAGGIFDVVAILGKDLVLKRINRILEAPNLSENSAKDLKATA